MLNTDIKTVFTDKNTILLIQEKLPKLFRIAEIESYRAEKLGMKVGSIREKILISLLNHKFGKENVNSDIPITKHETDVIFGNKEISIKTITGSLRGVKAVWTVDSDRVSYFVKNYTPKYDLILAQISWGTNKGGLYFIPSYLYLFSLPF